MNDRDRDKDRELGISSMEWSTMCVYGLWVIWVWVWSGKRKNLEGSGNARLLPSLLTVLTFTIRPLGGTP